MVKAGLMLEFKDVAAWKSGLAVILHVVDWPATHSLSALFVCGFWTSELSDSLARCATRFKTLESQETLKWSEVS